MNAKNIVFIKTEYIKLGQFLKLCGLISNGSESKFFLLDNKIYVNGELEDRRGRKIYPGYSISINNVEYLIKMEGIKNE